MVRHHDLGGQAAPEFEANDHRRSATDVNVDALVMLLTGRNVALFNVDELRRTIEDFSPDHYEHRTYYERWLEAVVSLAVEKGVFSLAELEREEERVRVEWGL